MLLTPRSTGLFCCDGSIAPRVASTLCRPQCVSQVSPSTRFPNPPSLFQFHVSQRLPLGNPLKACVLVRNATIGLPASSTFSKRAMSSSAQLLKRSNITTASAVSSDAGLERDFVFFGLIVPSGSSEKRTVVLNP